MKIYKITEEEIIFDNGSKITYDHNQDCCEVNYADFCQIEESAKEFDFPEDLIFEAVNGFGFRFGGNRMFFIPCYSVQNGYYTTEINIYFNGKCVISTECEYSDG